MNRAAFVRSSGAAAAAAAFLRSVALGAERGGLIEELTPLVKSILPFGTDGFPAVRAEVLVGRMGTLFGLDGDPVFLGSLAAFSEVASFPVGSDTLFAAERAAGDDVDVASLTLSDARAFSAAAVAKSSSFEALDAASRLRYVSLWERSAFCVRRRFFSSVRALTFSAFYSMPEVWPWIGYAGPLLGPR